VKFSELIWLVRREWASRFTIAHNGTSTRSSLDLKRKNRFSYLLVITKYVVD